MIITLAAGPIVLAAVGYAAFIGADASDSGEGLALLNVSAAMAPTLLAGERLTATRLTHPPKLPPGVVRGDLVVFAYPPEPEKRFVKRLLGLPGDTLAMREGRLVVNGQALDEPYAWHAEPGVSPPAPGDFAWQADYLARPAGPRGEDPASRNDWGPLVVPPGSYFMLGDNRDNSLDSRYFGFVGADQLLARVRRVYYSRDPRTGTIRWARFGHRLQ